MARKKKKKAKDTPLPTFRGKKATLIPMEEGPQSFVFAGKDDQLLHLAWDVDREGYGFWRARLIGLEENAPVKKEFRAGQERVAFYGSVAVPGPAGNELFDSFGFSDDDFLDHEGNVINKPVEVLLRPHRED
jgi:hypothetical protein